MAAPTRTLTNDPDALLALIRREATAAGFDAVGICAADGDPRVAEGLAGFLAAGHHGDMDWMEAHAFRRSSPKNLWPEARSVIMLAMNYGPDSDPLEGLTDKTRGLVSVYAQSEDYHEVIKPRLKQVARALAAASGAEVKVFVDTAPLMEKPLAQKAGLGFQGKHTNLVSREFGSWLFLGAILTPLALPLSPPHMAHCGACVACLDICPTNALISEGKIDARRCISYLTIENKGPIPLEFREKIGNRIYGCDDCLAVCPWNKFAQAGKEAKLVAKDTLKDLKINHILRLDDAEFRALFARTPVKRIGRARFIRNALIAAGNSQEMALISVIVPLLDHETPLVRGSAVWALGQLDKIQANVIKTRYISMEKDVDVLTEWDLI
jgi:epoxyqueuosine reductase